MKRTWKYLQDALKLQKINKESNLLPSLAHLKAA